MGGHEDVESGVYFGWAGLSSSEATTQHPPGASGSYKLMDAEVYEEMNKSMDKTLNDSSKKSTSAGAVYPMVMSIGWNPFYKNEVRSVEVHIMQDIALDFYESHMNLIILAFIRPEYDYVSVESLIEDIKTDINVAGRSLAREAYAQYANDPYLLEFSDRSEVAS